MVEVPRALILDADRQFAESLCKTLQWRFPEMAVKIAATLDEATAALDTLRPHFFLLDWSVRTANRGPGNLLRKMSELMDDDPSSYEYPLLVNWNWHSEYEQEWSDQTLVFRLDNPWIVLDKHSEDWVTAIERWHLRKILPRRILRLSKASVDLTRTAYLKVSDRPLRVEYWDLEAGEERSAERHRDDTFQQISDRLLSPVRSLDSVRSVKSLFVRANQRNSLVNLAYVHRIEFGAGGDPSFIVKGAHQAPRLSAACAPALAELLQGIRFSGLWPHIGALTLPS
jgi:hypothetical protein